MFPARVPTALPARHAELIGRALAFVEAHLDAALDADTLADQAALSRHHFHRVFRAQTGYSVGDYVTWRRLQRACALLASGREPVLDIALAVGYDSSQSLAKALRRELGTTAGAVRRGASAPWKSLLDAKRLAPQRTPGALPMQPSRIATLPGGITALTATSRGMVSHTMVRAAQQAYGELLAAVGQAGAIPRIATHLSLAPDQPQGPDDPHCRFVAGVTFGHAVATGTGACEQPPVPLSGTLAWLPLAPGRHAVFTHTGPFSDLRHTWEAIYRDWLPASGAQLRDAPPLRLNLNRPHDVPPEQVAIEIWIPIH